ncbi:hypothetical protein [Benzoatithermus flavus]|uniref:Uncharacterized protein n=1 Tax=Benzoatithermus flavus TaxID=3108223 RepID=A0ABU8XS65_9PROT
MARERYPGERRGLSLFLENLLPIAERVLGHDALLFHAIRRALHTGDLDHLRHARTLFNHLPREQRHALSAAVVASSNALAAPPKDKLLASYARREPAPFVSFESPQRGHGPPSVTLGHELLPPSPVRVIVTPGTLPRTAADSLRRIAGMIERDRRLLSERYWRGRGDEKSADEAPGDQSDSG